MIGMLVEIFCQYAVTGGKGITRLRQIFFTGRRVVFTGAVTIVIVVMM